MMCKILFKNLEVWFSEFLCWSGHGDAGEENTLESKSRKLISKSVKTLFTTIHDVCRDPPKGKYTDNPMNLKVSQWWPTHVSHKRGDHHI